MVSRINPVEPEIITRPIQITSRGVDAGNLRGTAGGSSHREGPGVSEQVEHLAARGLTPKIQPVLSLIMEQSGVQIFHKINPVVQSIFPNSQVLWRRVAGQQPALRCPTLFSGSKLAGFLRAVLTIDTHRRIDLLQGRGQSLQVLLPGRSIVLHHEIVIVAINGQTW